MSFFNKTKKCVKKSKYFVHETKRSVLTKFLLVVTVFIVYFVFMSLRYGLNNGFMATILTWSFFVFCTPISDAGLLLDFPIRLVTGIRMIYSEVFVWILAFLLNVYSLTFNQSIYNKTMILWLFKHILTHPFPFWTIIIVSAIGTFMSVYFGDELIDASKHKERKKYGKHKNKYKLLLILFMIILTLILYDFLLKKLGVNII
jgi:hypothetical protein